MITNTNGANGGCPCVTCRSGQVSSTTYYRLPFPIYSDLPEIEEPYRPPAEHILREQADRERAAQRQARNQARRALSRVAGHRASEQSRALSVRALSLKRAA